MAERRLRIGRGLTFPVDAVTQTFVIFGKRGSGKSNTAVVMAEEMHRVGAPFVVLDPVSAWWGLKSSFDGKGEGLPVYVFGGPPATRDLPLEPSGGELMAQVFIEHRIPMILDMKGWTGGERARFVTAFALHLLGHNDRQPAHVFLEEADAFIPQRPYKGEEAMLGAMDRLIRWGRQEGIGATAVSQRSAKINKDVTTQAETLIAHRTTGPQDREAIDGWIKYHAGGDERQELLSTLPTLPDGVAWIWSPEWLDVFRQVTVRRRETYDSAGTPKLGETRVQPKALAEVDLDRLRGRMEATIEKAEASDPAKLQARIRQLEREAATRPTEQVVETVVERVEVPILNGEGEDLKDAIRALHPLADGLGEVAGKLLEVATRVSVAVDDAKKLGHTNDAPGGATQAPRAVAAVQRRTVPPPPPTAARPVSAPRPPRDREVESGDVRIGKAERAILASLQLYPTGLTRTQLAFLAGYHQRAKSYTNALGALRSSGLIGPDFPVVATPAGLELDVGVTHTAGDLVEFWIARLGRAERAIVEHLVDIYPAAADREELVRIAGYEHVRTKSFTNALGRVRGLGLVDGFTLHADFAALTGRHR